MTSRNFGHFLTPQRNYYGRPQMTFFRWLNHQSRQAVWQKKYIGRAEKSRQISWLATGTCLSSTRNWSRVNGEAVTVLKVLEWSAIPSTGSTYWKMATVSTNGNCLHIRFIRTAQDQDKFVHLNRDLLKSDWLCDKLNIFDQKCVRHNRLFVITEFVTIECCSSSYKSWTSTEKERCFRTILTLKVDRPLPVGSWT